MKSIIVLLAAGVLLANAAKINLASKSHDLTLGTVGDDDWILWNKEVKQTGSWWPWSSVDGWFNYTVPTIPSSSQVVITAIRAMDKSPLGKGGYANLVSGGVGSNHVNIHFTSQEYQGLDFLVVIYGIVPS